MSVTSATHTRSLRVGADSLISCARYAAQTLELTGWVENEDDGSVTLEVQGDPEKFLRLFAMIQKSDYIQITGIRQKDLPPDPWERGFSVKGY